MAGENSEYLEFLPRPEAHAMRLDDLMPPVQKAVFELLNRVADSEAVRVKNAEGHNGEVSNCFLVYGARGTGKTTVLLTAKEVVCQTGRENIFKATNYGDEQRKLGKKLEKNVLDEFKNKCERGLKNIVWLDVLDLEPLLLDVNMLTTMLIRIRSAVDISGCKQKETRLRSIYEEDKDSADQQFTRLIEDATLAWESIHEQDTRTHAHRQIAAAEIYAKFSDRFKKAMGTLSKELALRHGGSVQNCSIVLPIDNIDRSTEHLHQIFKLAPILSNRHLWLVMAGDRENIETFLERAYWKELIYSNVGIGAIGKRGPGGEDEAFTMARHQAAAASHKLLPPSHRIEIGLMKGKETLAFFLPDEGCTHKGDSIEKILERVIIPTTKDQRIKEASGNGIKLIDRFDIQEKLVKADISETLDSPPSTTISVESEIISVITQNQRVEEIGHLELHLVTNEHPPEKTNNRVLTRTAEHALYLPARGVLDLWQLASSMARQPVDSENPDFKAEKIIRTMLRQAISESKMPSWMAQLLQDNIIRRTIRRGTLLFFLEANLELKYLCATCFAGQSLQMIKDAGYTARSQLKIDAVEDVIVLLNRQYYPSSVKDNDSPEPFVITTDKEYTPELPPFVASWLMILHDILLLTDENDEIQLAAANHKPKKHQSVSVTHEVIYRPNQKVIKRGVSIDWSVPDWNTFWAHEIFSKKWSAHRKKLRKLSGQLKFEKFLPRILAANWIACILKTYIAFNQNGPSNEQLIHKSKKDWNSVSSAIMELACFDDLEESTIANFEKSVMKAAADLYAVIELWRWQFDDEERRTNLELGSKMQDWLEQQLPLFLLDYYVPLELEEGNIRREDIIAQLSGTYLMEIWKLNWPFIFADLEENLAKHFNPESEQEGTKNQGNPAPNLIYQKVIGRFVNFDGLREN